MPLISRTRAIYPINLPIGIPVTTTGLLHTMGCLEQDACDGMRFTSLCASEPYLVDLLARRLGASHVVVVVRSCGVVTGGPLRQSEPTQLMSTGEAALPKPDFCVLLQLQTAPGLGMVHMLLCPGT